MADPNSPDGPNGIYVLPWADVSHVRDVVRDVAYATGSPFQTFDLYRPDGTAPAAGWPVVVFIHGGAWMMCDKRDIQLEPPLRALAHGYAVVSVNYRLSQEAQFPAQVFDIKAAVRCLRGRAAEFGLNPARLALWGGSAGAHLALMAGISAGHGLTDPAMGWPDQPEAVQAVVSWFGPTDFALMDVHAIETGVGDADHSRPDSPESLLLGGPVLTVPDRVAQANPVTWTHADCPPVLFQHGTADPLVPFPQSVILSNHINSVAGKDRAILELLKGAAHGGPEFETDANMAKVIGFLDSHLTV